MEIEVQSQGSDDNGSDADESELENSDSGEEERVENQLTWKQLYNRVYHKCKEAQGDGPIRFKSLQYHLKSVIPCKQGFGHVDSQNPEKWRRVILRNKVGEE